ncbi:NUDIX domain-containing protein [Paenibacillus cellulosilyticus]|uniref:NUDIX domain-containing protein n=1 Tax=Paenibacillus cellulosilyticus TaxID=375489 RepID=A0A2V2Z0J7_9BACL|nr:NUDIX domain-containing protein [Paenibacillus cellulosilyticus]PWW06555.1 NUDIX domain-containing protein [Paenibacillus cellulosilyticus]QKS46109.1 NUDIX domain-containing protein [Paenibacillus cellulosilyticus]
MAEKEALFHRHIGVYGICMENNHLLVIRKMCGPYKGRYDLPGGRLENAESLHIREFREETGSTVLASPLVLQAVDWSRSGTLPVSRQSFDFTK